MKTIKYNISMFFNEENWYYEDITEYKCGFDREFIQNVLENMDHKKTISFNLFNVENLNEETEENEDNGSVFIKEMYVLNLDILKLRCLEKIGRDVFEEFRIEESLDLYLETVLKEIFNEVWKKANKFIEVYEIEQTRKRIEEIKEKNKEGK